MKGNLARPHLLGFSDEGLKKCNHSSPAYILRQNKRRLTPQCRMGIVFFLPFNAGFLCLTKTIYIWWGYDCSTLPMHSTGSAALTPRSSAVLPKLFCPEHNRPKIRGTNCTCNHSCPMAPKAWSYAVEEPFLAAIYRNHECCLPAIQSPAPPRQVCKYSLRSRVAKRLKSSIWKGCITSYTVKYGEGTI